MLLRKSEMSHYVTESINAIQGIVMLLIVFTLFKFDVMISKMKKNEKSIYSLVSFLILLTGRFLSSYFMVFQIIMIRCGFKNLSCEIQVEDFSVFIESLFVLANVCILSAVDILNSKDNMNLGYFVALIPLLAKLNDEEQFVFINAFLKFKRYPNNSFEYQQVRRFYYKHKRVCTDLKCPINKECKISDIDSDHYGIKLTQNEDDLRHGLTKEFINKILTGAVFFHFNESGSTSKVKFMEIFLKFNDYDFIISTYYKLMDLKNKNLSRNEKQKYEFLQLLMTQKYNLMEKKHDHYDIEKVMQIEQEYITFKQTMIDVTINVQKFWQGLLNRNIQLSELMTIGNRIVLSYIDQKECYDSLIKKKPDFSEVAILNYQFCYNVMNFELEANEAQIVFKKIKEKQKIMIRNFYNVVKTDSGLLIISNHNGKRNNILMVNQLFEEIVGMTSQSIINKNINQFMPRMISIVHDRILDNYFTTYNGIPYERVFERLWFKRIDEAIIPIQARVLTCISQTHGLLLVGNIEFAPPVLLKNLSYNSNQVYFLIADEEGFVINTSQNFLQKFFNTKNNFIQDYRFNVCDIFPLLGDYSKEDLQNGVGTKMNKYFYNHQIDFKKTLDINLIVNECNFKHGIQLKEIYFLEDFTMSILHEKSMFIKDLQTEQNAYFADELSDYGNPTAYFQSQHMNKVMTQIDRLGGKFVSPSGSISSESSNSSSQKGMLQIKNMLDFKKLPQSLVNLKRAVIIYFVVMISTSIAMLTVTLVSHHQFHEDQEMTKNTIYIDRELSNLRLSYRMLIFVAQRKNNSVFLTYDDQIEHIREFFGKLQYYQNQMIDDDHPDNAELQKLITQNVLPIEEINQNGYQSLNNVTFFLGTQQFLSKVAAYLQKSEDEYVQIFQNFYLSDTNNNLTDDQRDAWFIVFNGNKNIRNFMLDLSTRYLYDGKNKEKGYIQTLLIITCLCIGISVVSTGILSPTTSNLDDEELNVIYKWNMIQDATKKVVLENICSFIEWMQQVEADRTKIPDIEKKVVQQIQMNSTQIRHGDLHDISYSSDRSLITIQRNQASFHKFPKQKSSKLLNHDDENFSEIKIDDHFSGETSFLDYISAPNLATFKSTAQEINEDKIPNLDPQEQQKLNGKKLVKKQRFQKLKQTSTTSEVSISHEDSLRKNFQSMQSGRLDVIQESQVVLNQGLNQKQNTQSIEESEIFKKQDIQRLFRLIKLKRLTVFTLFTSIVIGFFLGQYFITHQVITEATDSFNMQFIFSQRISCLTNSLNFMLETYAENKTQYIGYENIKLQDYILQKCGDIETQVQDYTRYPPPQMQFMIDHLRALNTDKACYVAFEDQIDIDWCLSKINKIMSNGYRNAFQQTYYHLTNELIQYESIRASQRTKQYMRERVYKSQTQLFMDLYFDILRPISYRICELVDASIDVYLDVVLDRYFVLFGVFLGFLVFSLIITFKYSLFMLKQVVLRTRMLIKIIPIDELKTIMEKKKVQTMKRA
ncbi:UNKNOWN [Stylonychia lemnae]|uniref:Pas domain s-box family protein n=1 Tax=Stylonychia lemnae TaxID=5949 RepID=A0A077ZPY0_STYLE|nr:UNKNOWN [Stylonychia lemnae]|eukprot:CDW71958.1 UNKNOWN [Stylonychia lemnae]